MLKWYIHEQGVRDFLIVAPSNLDVVQTIISGPAGVLRSYADDDPERPTYSPHHGILRYPNGAIGRTASSESPERVRGVSSELVICDELGSFSGDAVEFWENIEYGLRLGVSQAIICTTPRSTPLMISLVERGKDENSNVRIISGSTLENEAHLTPQMLAKAKATMNTRLGRQEVCGELILTNDRACWSHELLDKSRAAPSGEFHPQNWVEAAIGVDPSSGQGKKSSDLTGVVVAVKTSNNKILIVEDRTARMSGDQCSKTVGELFEKYQQYCPTKVHVEKNGVGALYKTLFLRDRPFMPVQEFPTTTQKYARAMTVAHLYETDIVFHSKDADLTDMELEQTSWEGSGKSPDHIDALGFAVNALVDRGGFTKRKRFII